MAGAGGMDAIQSSLTGSIDYALWHVEDRFMKADSRPIRGSFREHMPSAEDLNVPVPQHPAHTGDDNGMYGKTTRYLSPAQQKRAPALSVGSRPQNPGSQLYTIDPLEKSSKLPFLQKGKWSQAKGGIDAPALARHWAWSMERDVGTNLSDTAFTYSSVAPGWKKPIWPVHFGLNAARPTFGKIKCPQSAHQAPATLAHEMSMDKELFSPFRTTEQPSLSMPPSRSVTPMLSGAASRQGSRVSRGSDKISLRPRSRGLPEEPCLPHDVLGCMLCLSSPPADVQSMEVRGLDCTSERALSPGVTQQTSQSDVFSMVSADFGRVASPAARQNATEKVILARSCPALDGIERSLITLPQKWGPLQHMIKDEVVARDFLQSKTQRQVLHEAPKHIMRHLHAQMRSHPDSPWEPTCFTVQ